MAAQQAGAHGEQCSIYLAVGHCHHVAALVILSQQIVHWLTNQLDLTISNEMLIFRKALGLWRSSSDD